MQKIGTTTFFDANDAAYTFDVYPVDADLNATGAVYVVARRRQADDGSFAYDPVYIGQTEDISKHLANHPRRACFREYDADVVCVFTDDEKTTRQEIETVLLQRHEAPCNHVD